MNNDLFLKLYNDIENQIIRKYALPENYQSAMIFYTRKIKDQSMKVRLDQVRKLRNFLVHEDTVLDYDMFMISDSIILFLKDVLYRLIDPLKAYDICKKENLYYRTLNDSVKETMQFMRNHGYSHTPILSDKKKLIGVFSESTMFSYVLSKDGKVLIDEQSTIHDYYEIIQLGNHSSERYAFISKECEIINVIHLFKKYEADNKKLKMVFVTENGKEDEALLGVITPLDILKI